MPLNKIKKTKKVYEEYLNDLYYGQDISEGQYSYINAIRLLRVGKLGTALRKHDPIAFYVGYSEWRP